MQRPAADVWAELTTDNPLGWCRIIDRIEWTSPRPFTLGTTRTVYSLRGTSNFRELFFRWEEGARKSFYVLQATSPVFRSFAEDYLVEPTSETTCRFTWTIAYTPRAAARPLNPVSKRILSTLLADTGKHYA